MPPKRALVEKLSTSVLIRGSVVLTIGNLFANFGNYAFNLLVGRFLGPADYGVMASVIALLYIVSVPSASLNLIGAKFSSRFKAEGEFDQLAYFFVFLNKIFLLLSFLVLLLFIFLSDPLSDFLKIDSPVPVIFLGALLGASLLVALNNSILQGLLRFNFLALSSVIAVAVKLVVGIGLIGVGLAVGGALTGFFAAFLLPYLISFFPLRFLLSERGESANVDWSKVIKFATPVLLSTLGLTLLYTGDVVLVKHFFPPAEAGLYSALSLIARVILFVTAPIAAVMFPLISEKHAQNGRYLDLFLTSLLLVALATVSITAFYFIFPEFTVRLFFGNGYLSAASYLGRFGVFLSLYSLCNLFASFYLSIHKVRIASLPLAFGLLQTGLIWLYHDTFLEVLQVATGVALTLLLCFVLYLPRTLRGVGLDKMVRT